MKQIPVLLVAGFLGAGKTTLMRRLILDARERNLRAAVVVNEFGIEDVDSHILKQADAELLASISGGCACCSGQDELHWALLEMGSRPPAEVPDVILMEASGLADPVLLLDVLTAAELLPVLRLGAIASVVDAERFGTPTSGAGAGMQGAGVLMQRQVQLSDLIVLNKADLIDETILEQTQAAVKHVNNRADIQRAVQADIPLDTLWARVFDTAAPAAATPARGDAPDTHGMTQTVTCPVPHPIERARLEAALQGLGEDVWRGKGFVRLRGEEGLFLLQFTGGPDGGRYTIAPFYMTAFSDEPSTALVFIGAALDKAQLLRDFSGVGNLLTMM